MKSRVYLSAWIVLMLLMNLNSKAQNAGAIFEKGPDLNRGKIFPVSTLLPDGKVISFGGRETGFISCQYADIYDPTTNIFSEVQMLNPHDAFTVTKLENGEYLILGGGYSSGIPAYNTAEIFNPTTGQFTATTPMNISRMMNFAVQLKNKKVLVAGGWYDNSPASTPELFDLETQTWTNCGQLLTPRAFPLVLPTADSNALVLSGFPIYGGSNYESVELYSSATNLFTLFSDYVISDDPGWLVFANQTQTMDERRLNDGRYVIPAYRALSGGGNEYALLLFDPETKSFTKFQTSNQINNEFNDGGWIDVVVNRNDNLVYIVGVDANFDPQRISVVTVNISTGDANIPTESYELIPNEYFYSSMTYMPSVNKILVVGINSSTASYFNATPETYLMTPSYNIGIENNDLLSNLKLYPNPSSEFLNIEFDNINEKRFAIEIHNVMGQKVYSEQFTNDSEQVKQIIDLSTFTSGTYFISLQNNKKITVRKFIKQ